MCLRRALHCDKQGLRAVPGIYLNLAAVGPLNTFGRDLQVIGSRREIAKVCASIFGGVDIADRSGAGPAQQNHVRMKVAGATIAEKDPNMQVSGLSLREGEGN